MKSRFDTCFERLIGHEGGYVNHKNDPGGETNFGISKRSYPQEDIKGMTLERAKQIYKRDFWDKAKCGRLPKGVDFDVFDTAVNSGVLRATIFLQRAAGVIADGVIGPKTLEAVNSTPDAVIQARFNGERLSFMADLPTWPTFGRGWARRVAENLKGIGQ
ncbi:glycoside hydrolase family 108 protein [Acidovorax sp.]|uniref:glycoside hydrolase family 108 protein n=1 Tax=Acidovorax sp. TaxID=1872122 RepID=UPI00391ABD5F